MNWVWLIPLVIAGIGTLWWFRELGYNQGFDDGFAAGLDDLMHQGKNKGGS